MSAETVTVDINESKEEGPMVVDSAPQPEKEAVTECEPLVDTGLTDTAFPQIVVNKMPRVSMNHSLMHCHICLANTLCFLLY